VTTNEPIRRIALLTGGGDAPGLNAVIRAAVKTAVTVYGWEVFGIEDGFEGLLGTPRAVRLTPDSVRGLLPRGGTVLGTTSKGSFGRSAIESDPPPGARDVIGEAAANLKSIFVDALVTIGGDGTQTIAGKFHERGVRVVGVPKTIDNDLACTDLTFGFDSAVAMATDACDRLHTTAESHDRLMVLEVMGRTAGWIALHAGIAGGADIILIPEVPFDWERLRAAIERRDRAGHSFSIVVAAEGAAPAGGAQKLVEAGHGDRAARFGGIGMLVAERLGDLTGKDARVVVLGHLQRGGRPTAFDRLLATALGAEAIRAVAEGAWGSMVATQGSTIRTVPFEDVCGRVKQVHRTAQLLGVARGLGIELGAEA
jgi:6-phosphofructokinase 1